MSKMLSPDEVEGVYASLKERGEAGKPYVLHYEVDGAHVTFFGSIHTSDQMNSQWGELQREWATFLDHNNQNKILLIEKGDAARDKGSKEEMISRHGESGYAVWLAQKVGVAIESPEPDRVEEIEYLRGQGYTDRDIIHYYFGRQMHQWVRQDKDLEPNWRTYAEDTINRYNSLDCWQNRLGLPTVLAWHKEVTGKSFDVSDERALYDISDPSQNPVSAASGAYRDMTISHKIQQHAQAGKDVFVVYGSGHAIRLESELDHMFSPPK